MLNHHGIVLISIPTLLVVFLLSSAPPFYIIIYIFFHRNIHAQFSIEGTPNLDFHSDS